MITTPGPWYVENILHGGPRIVHGEPNDSGLRDDVPFRESTEIAQGNTCLAAAAPELLDALEIAYRSLSQYKAGDELIQIRAAISKAKGAF